MTTISAARIARVTEPLINDIALRRATYYVTPTLVVKATRQRPVTRRSRSETLLVTFGVPNYSEQRFIATCKKAKVPFPVRKVQLQVWPVKRKA